MDQDSASFRRRTVGGLSAVAGAALVNPAQAADGTKIGSHQYPGNCSTPRSSPG